MSSHTAELLAVFLSYPALRESSEVDPDRYADDGAEAPEDLLVFFSLN